MNTETFGTLVKKARERRDKILKAKGDDYTNQNADRLFNFKFIAQLLNISPRVVWGVYFLKHVLAVMNHVKNNHESEPIEGRLDDVANYCDLYEALLYDEKGVQTAPDGNGSSANQSFGC